MKKQLLRNRRSASSCSNYSQHSSSLANLQSDPGTKQKKYDYIQIQKPLLLLYTEIKSLQLHNNSNNHSKQMDYNLLPKWRQILKTGIRQLREYFNFVKDTMGQLRNTLEAVENGKNLEIRNLTCKYEEELGKRDRENGVKINQIKEQMNKKQQQYKQVVTKFVNTLHKSQKIWSKTHLKLSQKLKKCQSTIRTFLAPIPQDSLPSINLSYDQLPQPSHLHLYGNGQAHAISNFPPLSSSSSSPSYPYKNLEEKRNTIDISSIDIQQLDGIQEDPDELDQGDQGDQADGDGVQDCLAKLVTWGFFGERNLPIIKKIIQITKNLDCPQAILREPIYPIILQSLKLNLDIQKDNSIMLQQDSTGLQYQHNQRPIMHNISNTKY